MHFCFWHKYPIAIVCFLTTCLFLCFLATIVDLTVIPLARVTIHVPCLYPFRISLVDAFWKVFCVAILLSREMHRCSIYPSHNPFTYIIIDPDPFIVIHHSFTTSYPSPHSFLPNVLFQALELQLVCLALFLFSSLLSLTLTP